MWSVRGIAFGFALLLISGQADAAEALDLYAEGDFAQAIALAEAAGGGDGFALAARAALADAELRQEPCLDCLDRAGEFARAAIAADPEQVEAYIYLVVALGRRARLIGFFRAQREGIGGATDDAIEAALSIDPDYPWALAARGGWHIEVVRLAGRILGDLLFGASVQEGKDFFARAMAEEPANLVIPYQYALSLAAYDLGGQRADIEQALRRAVSLAPADFYETAIKARAAMLLAALEGGSDEAFLRLLGIYRGNP